MNNLERVVQEITKRAEKHAPNAGLPAKDLTRLVLEVVELEDDHKLRQGNINQEVMARIRAAAARLSNPGEST